MQKEDVPPYVKNALHSRMSSLENRKQIQLLKEKLQSAERTLEYHKRENEYKSNIFKALKAFNNVKERRYHLQSFVERDQVQALVSIIEQNDLEVTEKNKQLTIEYEQLRLKHEAIDKDIDEVETKCATVQQMLKEQYIHSRSIDDMWLRFKNISEQDTVTLLNIGCTCDIFHTYGLLHAFSSYIVWEPIQSYFTSEWLEPDDDSDSSEEVKEIQNIEIPIDQIRYMSPCKMLGKDYGITIQTQLDDFRTITFYHIQSRDKILEAMFSLIYKDD